MVMLAEVPRVAVIVVLVEAETVAAERSNVPVRLPAGMATESETLTKLGFAERSLTTTPPTGASYPRVTVPCWKVPLFIV
jgi:hypothetical protein